MKERVPAAILEMLAPASNEHLQYVMPVHDDAALLVLADRNPKSGFYFKVNKTEVRSQRLHYHIEYRPFGKETTDGQNKWRNIEGVKAALDSWLALVAFYCTAPSVWDDPITKSYADEFYSKFDIVDEDAARAPFNLEQQLFLDQYLASVEEKVEKLKAGRNEQEAAQLQEVAAEAADIRANLTKETKRGIARRLSRLWAKAQRVGLEVIKEIFVSVVSDLISKKFLTGG